MYQIETVKRIMHQAAEAVKANEEYLGELDCKSGDGDLGLSMRTAFKAIVETAESYEGTRMDELLMKVAMGCNRAAPSTMGTLISAGIMGMAKKFKGKSELSDEDVVGIPRVFAEAVMARGGAKPGDKTILDAICPMAECVEGEFAKGSTVNKSFQAGSKAAKAAAMATAGMHASVGRAKWLGDRAAEYPDGGAVLCALIMEALVKDRNEAK